MRSASQRTPRGVGLWHVVAQCAPLPARAAEYFVDNTSANCSNTGAGTLANPYCTITAALTARHAPGTIITVGWSQRCAPSAGAPWAWSRSRPGSVRAMTRTHCHG